MRPRLTKQLEDYSSIAQEALDSRIKRASSDFLSNCVSSYNTLLNASNNGDLSTAMSVAHEVEERLNKAPEPLPRAAAILDLKVCKGILL